MDSTEKQLTEMLLELQSRNISRIILESGVFGLILFVLFVGNFITLAIMLLNRQMRTIPNMFVASLAVSDFALGLLTACPLSFPVLVLSRWPFDDATCQYQGFLAVTLAIASIHTMTLMAVNRYFRILKPAVYRRYFTREKTTIMIILSWLYSMTASLPYLLSGHRMVFHPSKFFCYLQIDSGAFTAIVVTVYVGLPTCFIIFCYLRIYQFVRDHNRNLQRDETGDRAINVEEIKITRTLFAIVVVFNLCWTPLLIIDVVDTILGSWHFSREAYFAYSILGTMSSAINPMLYGVLNKTFQREYFRLFRCVYCRSHLVVEPSLALEK